MIVMLVNCLLTMSQVIGFSMTASPTISSIVYLPDRLLKSFDFAPTSCHVTTDCYVQLVILKLAKLQQKFQQNHTMQMLALPSYFKICLKLPTFLGLLQIRLNIPEMNLWESFVQDLPNAQQLNVSSTEGRILYNTQRYLTQNKTYHHLLSMLLQCA